MALSLALLCAAHPAAARDSAMPPSDAGTSFAVAITGYITPKCTLATREDTSARFSNLLDRATGRADASATLALPFTMDCNAPYVATLTSKNGGLAYDGALAPSFAGAVDYDATLDMSAIDHGVALSCDSRAMRATDAREDNSRCYTRSDDQVASATGRGFIRLKLQEGSEPLQKGVYSDELVLKITPRVSG